MVCKVQVLRRVVRRRAARTGTCPEAVPATLGGRGRASPLKAAAPRPTSVSVRVQYARCDESRYRPKPSSSHPLAAVTIRSAASSPAQARLVAKRGQRPPGDTSWRGSIAHYVDTGSEHGESAITGASSRDTSPRSPSDDSWLTTRVTTITTAELLKGRWGHGAAGRFRLVLFEVWAGSREPRSTCTQRESGPTGQCK